MDKILQEDGTSAILQEDGASFVLQEFDAPNTFDPKLYSMQMAMMGAGQM